MRSLILSQCRYLRMETDYSESAGGGLFEISEDCSRESYSSQV